MPNFKTIADFRKGNGEAIRTACREFVVLCRGLGLVVIKCESRYLIYLTLSDRLLATGRNRPSGASAKIVDFSQ